MEKAGKRKDRERMEGEACNGSEVTYHTPDGGVITCKVSDKATPDGERDRFFVCVEQAGSDGKVTMGMSANVGWLVSMVFNLLEEDPEVGHAVRGRIMMEVLGALGKKGGEREDEELGSRFDKTIGKGRAH